MEGFKLPDRLVKKQAERLAEKEQKKLAAAEITGVDKFIQEFEERQKIIQNFLKDAENGSIDSSDLEGHFDKISHELTHLQTIFSHFTIALPQFQLRKYQAAIFELEEKLQVSRDKLIPKKRFSFKNRKPEPSTKNVKFAPKDEVDSCVSAPSLIFANECGFSDQQNTSLILHGTDCFQKDVSLSNLSNCTVRVCGSPSTVHITNIKDSTILIGPVSTSVFLDDCSNCDIAVACQQLRVHSSNSINFYIHVTSRCIIEDSTNIRVAPYTWRYESYDEDFKASKLDPNSNNWNDLDDFNWLAKDKASPNWMVLSEDSRKKLE
nr:PREDICTED: tubulin-specific chaperone C isoform X1 [Bemisia tabaci]XP_018897185.1 PREDICTED: tubulin-specific chaperone C isoform X1 [Bemisia tabaci]XP_018897186.1 PREDICTED: tubulin-specific chaperone C isoform X1 [Bemisia tabaci]